MEGSGKGKRAAQPYLFRGIRCLKNGRKTYLVYMVGYENKFVSYMYTDSNKVTPYHNRVNLHLFQSIHICHL